MANKPKILIFIDWFKPAFKAGGPIRSVSNIVTFFHHEFDFFIITSDHDHDGTVLFSQDKLDKWVDIDNCKVAYLSDNNRTKFIREVLGEIAFSKIYFNSMYSVNFTLQPIRLLKKLTLDSELILAPRGMLHAGALNQRRLKKSLFLKTAKFLDWFRGVTFQATDEQEKLDILKQIGGTTKVIVAANLPNPQIPFSTLPKDNTGLRMIYMSRIAPLKNVLFLLRVMEKVRGKLNFDIIGPYEDKSYVKACKEQAAKLPSNIKVQFLGAVLPTEISEMIPKYHLSTLPSKSENFGHAIFEALQMGKPVLIGKETPWQNLTSQKVGWDLGFEDEDKWIEALEEAINWDQQTYDLWAKAAWKYAHDFQQRTLTDTSHLFGDDE